MASKFETLVKEIIILSESATWEHARAEWELHDIEFAEYGEPGTCLCGHNPIIELCEIRNRHNDNFATVGNCCVKKFLGLPSDLIFQGVKRIKKDEDKSSNDQTAWFAYQKKWITEWEYKFYIDIMKKRNLSTRQMEYRNKVNRKILLGLAKKK